MEAEGMIEWAYHATERRYLARIQREGLVPRNLHRVRKDRRTIRCPAIFFAERPQDALLWNDVLLRFPFPEVYEQDPDSDTILFDDGTIGSNSWYTWMPVPPDVIEVFVGDTSVFYQREGRTETRPGIPKWVDTPEVARLWVPLKNILVNI